MKYKNTDTGEIWTEEEIKEAYVQQREDLIYNFEVDHEELKDLIENPHESFERHLEYLLEKGALVRR